MSSKKTNRYNFGETFDREENIIEDLNKTLISEKLTQKIEENIIN
jgi:hypothetical protein